MKKYLNNFDDKAEGYGEGCQDDQQGDEGDKVSQVKVKVKNKEVEMKKYLNNFDDKAEGYGEGGQDDQQGDEGDEVKMKSKNEQ